MLVTLGLPTANTRRSAIDVLMLGQHRRDPVNTKCWPSAVLMLGHRLKRCFDMTSELVCVMC